jgi:RNA polymerase-binding protein DksA
MARNRSAVDAFTIEKTEDEGDLATMSHDRELLYNLYENDSARLKSIQKAIKAMDSDQYGECVQCEAEINEKRLRAVPWATLCIGCQEKNETENLSSVSMFPGSDAPDDV